MWIRRHLSYANVAATLALVFAMGGSAIAARHYLITSTRQISPRVLAKLKGNAGPAGPAGTAGPAGRTGATGPQGPTGKTGATGLEGEPGTARGYGAVTGEGPLNGQVPSYNVASVNMPKPGVYCILPQNTSEINLLTTIVIATISAQAEPGAVAESRSGIDTPGCGASGFEVDTYVLKANKETGVISDEPHAEPFAFIIP